MKIAICNETFGDWSIEKALSLAAECGYTGWEVAPFTLGEDWVDQFGPSHRAAYRRRVESAGLQVIGLHWLLAKTTGFHLTTRDSVVRRRTTDHFVELVRLCGDLGGELMVLGSPGQRNRTEGQSKEEAMRHAAEVLGGVLPTLHDHGVRIALEPLGPEEGNFLNTADEAMVLQQMIGDDAIGLHLDVKAMSTEGEPIDAIIRRHGSSMIHFHANDPNRQGPGMGKVDFVPIVRALRDVGYEGWVSVEVFDYSAGVETLVRRSSENLNATVALI